MLSAWMSVFMRSGHRGENEPVPLDRRLAAKRRRREPHPEVPALARACVPGVLALSSMISSRVGASSFRGPRGCGLTRSVVMPGASGLRRRRPGCCWRMIQKNCANVNTKSTTMKTISDFTHVASLVLNATARLAMPSSR